MSIRARLIVLGVLATLSISACGGGGGGGVPPPGPAQGPPSTSGAVVPAAIRTYELASAARSYDLPPFGGFIGSLALPAAAVPPNTQLQLTSSLQAPVGAPAPQDAQRHGAQAAGALDVYFYATIQLSSTVTFPTLPGFSVTLPATIKPNGLNFFYAISNPTPTNGAEVQFRSEGPATVSGQTLTFAASSTSLTLQAGQPYTIAFYAVTTLAATPTPAPASKIYVTTVDASDKGVLQTFDAKGVRTTPTVSELPSLPQGLAVDEAGRIYLGYFVIAQNDWAVTTYTPSGTETTPTITGLDGVSSIGVDAGGKIFIAANISYVGGVTTYTPSGAPTTPTITNLNVPVLAVSATGKIYVTDEGQSYYDSALLVYNPDGSESPLNIQGLDYPSAVAVGADGKIYIASSGNNAVTTYNRDGAQTFVTLTKGISGPRGIAVDASGKIYVANAGNGTVTTYNADGTQTTPTITGLNSPWAIAVH